MSRNEFVSSAGKLLARCNKTCSIALPRCGSRTRFRSTTSMTSVRTSPQERRPAEIHGGFAMCHFASEADVAPILDELKVTIRCIPSKGMMRVAHVLSA